MAKAPRGRVHERSLDARDESVRSRTTERRRGGKQAVLQRRRRRRDLPFYDERVVALYGAFERGLYAGLA